MKKAGPKALLIIPALLLAALLVWSAHPARRPEPPKIEPAQVDWPEAETVVDCRNLALRVPDPFKLTGLAAEVTGPGEDADLHFHEYVYDSQDAARFGIELDLRGIESYLQTTGHGWLTFHPLTFAGRPAVLAVEYGHLMHGESKLLHPRLYVLWDQSYLMIEHRHFAYLEVSEDDFDLGRRHFTGLGFTGTDSDKLSLAERERFREVAGDFMDHLGRGDFQGRDGGLKALNRLSRQDGADWEAYLSWADFDWWGHHHGPFHPYRQLGFKIWKTPFPFKPDEAGLRDGRPHAAARPLALDGRPGRETLLSYHYNDAVNWMFLWEKEPTPGGNYFWQFSLHIGDWDRAPQWLGLWRLVLDTVRFPPTTVGVFPEGRRGLTSTSDNPPR